MLTPSAALSFVSWTTWQLQSSIGLLPEFCRIKERAILLHVSCTSRSSYVWNKMTNPVVVVVLVVLVSLLAPPGVQSLMCYQCSAAVGRPTSSSGDYCGLPFSDAASTLSNVSCDGLCVTQAIFIGGNVLLRNP